MNEDDQDDVDFAAWAAPPAPPGLADRVIARVAATDEVIAGVVQRRRTRRVFWLAAGLLGTVAAMAVGAVVVMTRSPEPHRAANHGTTIATGPEHVVLPGAIANLDPGGEISWQASGDAIHVQQRRGSITWRADNHLFLEVGAAVASIEASNATLRVETRMNLSDVRVVGASALTAAAVALVTVSVYEGQARLSSAGQTVVVAPGSTYEVRQGQPPVVELNIAGTPPEPTPTPAVALSSLDELVVPLGETITIHNAGAPILIRVDTSCSSHDTPYYPEEGAVGPGDYDYSFTCNGIAKHGRIRVVRDVTMGPLFSPAEGSVWGDTVDIAGVEVSDRTTVSIEGVRVATTPGSSWHARMKPPAGLSFIGVRIERDGEIDYYIRHAAPSGDKTARSYVMEHIGHGMKLGPLSAEAIDATMKAIENSMVNCVKTRGHFQMLHFDVNPDGSVGNLYATIDDPASNACVVAIVRAARFPKASAGTSVSYSLAPACNSEDLIKKGTTLLGSGADAAALDTFEAALDCKYDDHTLQLAFMTACNTGNVATARRHWKVMDAESRIRLFQLCLRNHITQDQLDE